MKYFNRWQSSCLRSIRENIRHEVCYDILMLKIEQLFAILTIIPYNLLTLDLCWNHVIMLNLQRTKGRMGHEGNKGSEQRQQTKASRKSGRKRSEAKEVKNSRRKEGYPISRWVLSRHWSHLSFVWVHFPFKVASSFKWLWIYF